ncbi:MAG: 5-deoxy-glucuronate isomerase, partial [Chloroflexi bacterium]
MKYHSLLTASQGLNTLPTNPCHLLDFALLKLVKHDTYQAETTGREILAVILSGKAGFEINGKRFVNLGGRPNVFSGKPHSVYIPAGSKFCIQAEGPVEIALPSAPSNLEA